jgi:glycosyltransferase involved in cell wall biosynthesis
MKLSIVFPAYNEEKRIFPVLNRYYSFFMNKLGNSFEFIIVPNNCSDNTLDVVNNFSKHKKNVTIKNISNYVGKGGAILVGFKLAKGDLIGFVDSDESTSPEEFHKLYQNIGDFKGIIASRRMKKSLVSPRRDIHKRCSSFLFNLFVRLFFGFKFKDTQCGAKIFRREVIKKFVSSSKVNDWAFDIDLLYFCKINKYPILEFPISWKDSSCSHLTISQGIKSVLFLIKYRLFFKYPKH